MFKPNFILFLAIVLAYTLFIISCSDDDNATTPTDEFVADATTFDGWDSWTAIGFAKGPADNLGQAHAGNDENATRWIYMMDMGDIPDNGIYPQGTVIVKQVLDGDGNQIGLVAMAKRGGDFNSNYNGWEWFMWDENGNMMRGADLMDNACNTCHAAAATDYVFSDPAGHAVSEEMFDGWENWPIIAEEQGPDESLGAAHAGNDENAVRKIHFVSDNLKAAENGEYPWGAKILKQVVDGDGNLIGLTAMIKKGGDFNAEYGGWYWYRWTIEGGVPTGLMAEGIVGGCNSCHAQASALDYVFTVNN